MNSPYKSKMKTFVSFLGFIAVLGTALPAFSQSWLAGVTLVRGVVQSISGDMLATEQQDGLLTATRIISRDNTPTK